MKMYVYKEYRDDEAYGEEIIKLFPVKADAIKHLRQRIKDIYQCEVEEFHPDDEYATIQEDYVSFEDGKGCHFFVIEEHEALIPFEDIRKCIYWEEQKQFDINDIYQLIMNEGDVDDEAVVLNRDDFEEIQETFRDNHDWSKADYDALRTCINSQLDKPLDVSKEYIVPFHNPYTTLDFGCDEIAFKNVSTIRELGKLWRDYANENGFDPRSASGHFCREVEQ